MATKLVDCEHCGGKKNCTASGGRSCAVCMQASGMGKRGWAAVRCSYCGGRGKVLMKVEEEPVEEQEAEETGESEETEAEE